MHKTSKQAGQPEKTVNDNATGVSGPQDRRELLKKLGVAAGALVWSTPIVQTLAVGVAGAQAKTGCHDISHLDLLVTKSGATYGIQWDPGEGWGRHSTSNKHCLANDAWTRPPTSFLNGFPTPTKVGDSYQLAASSLPSGVTIVKAWSKAGTGCQPAKLVSGIWVFDKWCEGGTTSTTSTTIASTTTTRPNTSTTQQPTTSTTTVGGGSGGSPGPSHDISHMDLVVRLTSGGTTWYGVQYEFGGVWSKHPKGSANKEHCLHGLPSWSNSAPSALLTELRKTTVTSLSSGRYLFEMPATVTVRPASGSPGYTHDAFSKCASNTCTPATAQIVDDPFDADPNPRFRLTFRPCPKDDD